MQKRYHVALISRKTRRGTMLSERVLTNLVKGIAKQHLDLHPTDEKFFPGPKPGEKYMLYMHVPFCQVLCPYCSFNRYPFRESVARPYFENMRKEMMMLKDLGYDFESLYIGGGHADHHARRAVQDDRPCARQLQHQGSVVGDQPQPPRAAVAQ